MNTGQWSEYGIETEEYSSYVEEYADDGDINQLQLSERDLEELRHAIDPLQDDYAYGINTYLQVCLFVTERLY